MGNARRNVTDMSRMARTNGIVTVRVTGDACVRRRPEPPGDVACILLPAEGVAREAQTMQQESNQRVSARLLQVGVEVFAVYGDERTGWCLDPVDLMPQTPKGLRYASIDELFFALLNLNVTAEGRA
jgi:hypothetical protein